jgi:hypothetical protein
LKWQEIAGRQDGREIQPIEQICGRLNLVTPIRFAVDGELD